MRRRIAIAVLILASLAPSALLAQERVHRVAFLRATPVLADDSTGHRPLFDAVKKQLESHGFVEGRNLQMGLFFAKANSYDDPWMETMVREALAWKPDVLFVHTLALTRFVRQRGVPVPVVFAMFSDAVSEGIVASLARPGGNMTGASMDYDTLLVKRLELAREIFPALRRAVVISDTRGGGISASARAQLERAASPKNIALAALDASAVPGALCAISGEVARARGDVVLTAGSILPPVGGDSKAWTLEGYGKCLAGIQARTKVPVIDDSIDTIEHGVAFSLGEHQLDTYRRAANLAARILKGAKPSEVPVDNAMSVKLHVNARTVRELGISVPQSVMLRADRVIE